MCSLSMFFFLFCQCPLFSKSGSSPLDQWQMSYPEWELIQESIFTPSQMAKRFPLYQSHDRDANKWMPFRTVLTVFSLKEHLQTPINPQVDEYGTTDTLTAPRRVKEHRKVVLGKTPVDIVADEESCTLALDELCRMARGKGLTDCFVVGLDCRWTLDDSKYRRHYHQKLGLLVLCTTKRIVVIRLSKMDYVLPPKARSMLENGQIVKCGVGIADTVNRIYTDFGVTTKSAIDVDDAYRSFKGIPPRIARFTEIQTLKERLVKASTLKTLMESVFGMSLVHKRIGVESGNWNGTTKLSMLQIQLAADDAVVASKVFWRMIKEISGGTVERGQWMNIPAVKQFMDRSEVDIVRHDYQRGHGEVVQHEEGKNKWTGGCILCGQRGHYSFQCPNSKERKGRWGTQREREQTHKEWELSVARQHGIAIKRREKRTETSRNRRGGTMRGCKNCGRIGHNSPQCPLRRQTVSFVKGGTLDDNPFTQ